jgi:hypothetical protein
MINVLSYGFAGTVWAKPQLLHPYHDISVDERVYLQCTAKWVLHSVLSQTIPLFASCRRIGTYHVFGRGIFAEPEALSICSEVTVKSSEVTTLGTPLTFVVCFCFRVDTQQHPSIYPHPLTSLGSKTSLWL